jgi:hypothetical protein
VVQHRTVNPRSKQKISILTRPGATVSITVVFPNGDKKTDSGTANESGRLSWSYQQPGSRITRKSRTAKISGVAALDSVSASAAAKYTIGFAALDVDASPRKVSRGHAVSIWIHGKAYERVAATLRFHGGKTENLSGSTGYDGWTKLSYALPVNTPKGRVDVKATGYLGAGQTHAETSFRVK